MPTQPMTSPTDNGAWQVYVIECSDATLYTGITTDIDRRFSQHASGRGARYFRGRQPRRIVFLESGHSRSSASRREFEIKQLARPGKIHLIASTLNQLGPRRVASVQPGVDYCPLAKT